MRGLLLAIVMLLSPAAYSVQLPYEQVGREYGIDPGLLQAIARQESGENPYALNVNGEDMHCLSRDEAVRALRFAIRNPWVVRLPRDSVTRFTRLSLGDSIPCVLRGHAHDRVWFPERDQALVFIERHGIDAEPRRVNSASTDIGLMQINWHYHGQRVPASGWLLDPRENLRAAARYLVELSARFSTREIIERYHGSSNRDRRHAYGASVLNTYRQITCGASC